MIRINLLPKTKRKRQAESGGGVVWIGVYLVSVFIWGIILTFIHVSRNDKLDEQVRKNTELSAKIEQIKQRTGQLELVQAKIAASKQLEAVVTDLNTARLGPTRLMLELSRVLSQGGGPTIDPAKLERLRLTDPHAGFNRNWDPRRVWITSFAEANRNFAISGTARTMEDVGEFNQRLRLSELFEEARLIRTQTRPGAGNLAFAAFEIAGKVKY